MAAFASNSILDPVSNRKVCGLCTVSFSMKYDGGIHLGIMHDTPMNIIERIVVPRFESRREEQQSQPAPSIGAHQIPSQQSHVSSIGARQIQSPSPSTGGRQIPFQQPQAPSSGARQIPSQQTLVTPSSGARQIQSPSPSIEVRQIPPQQSQPEIVQISQPEIAQIKVILKLTQFSIFQL